MIEIETTPEEQAAFEKAAEEAERKHERMKEIILAIRDHGYDADLLANEALCNLDLPKDLMLEMLSVQMRAQSLRDAAWKIIRERDYDE